MHNPSIYGKYPNFEGIINVYNEEIFNNECYISDSMFSFSGKNPIEYIKKSENKLIQFLTHPAQYFSEGKISYEKPMNMIINSYYKRFDKIFRVNKIYSEQRKKYRKSGQNDSAIQAWYWLRPMKFANFMYVVGKRGSSS